MPNRSEAQENYSKRLQPHKSASKLMSLFSTVLDLSPYLKFQFLKYKTMNSTKTAVIIGIITLVVLGVLLYANRDKFSSNTATTATTTEE